MENRIKKNQVGKITVVDGVEFDSSLEARVYKMLKEVKDKGVIEKLELQPRFQLMNAFESKIYSVKMDRVYISKQREAKYTSDFLIVSGGEKYIVEAKGYARADYQLRRKLFLHLNQAIDFVFVELGNNKQIEQFKEFLIRQNKQ